MIGKSYRILSRTKVTVESHSSHNACFIFAGSSFFAAVLPERRSEG